MTRSLIVSYYGGTEAWNVTNMLSFVTAPGRLSGLELAEKRSVWLWLMETREIFDIYT
jgi:hypothetical protein